MEPRRDIILVVDDSPDTLGFLTQAIESTGATVLVALREVLGRDTFEKAFREYGRRWLGKHPTPWDFWNTFDDVTGQDLSWFWKEWFYETWKLDQALDTVRVEGDSAAIVRT